MWPDQWHHREWPHPSPITWRDTCGSFVFLSYRISVITVNFFISQIIFFGMLMLSWMAENQLTHTDRVLNKRLSAISLHTRCLVSILQCESNRYTTLKYCINCGSNNRFHVFNIILNHLFHLSRKWWLTFILINCLLNEMIKSLHHLIWKIVLRARTKTGSKHKWPIVLYFNLKFRVKYKILDY